MKFFRFLLSFIILAALLTRVELRADYDREEVSEAINRLAFDLLPLVNDQNTFFSPYSISSALALAFAGARGQTEEEMMKVLYFSDSQSLFHPAFHKVNQELEKRKNEGIILNIANALWIDRNAELADDFLVLTNLYYGAGDNRLNFLEEPEQSRIKINGWIEEKTEDRIKDILQPGDVTSDTRLILTNAIYFLGSWQHVFSEDLTREEEFFVSPENPQKAHFMKRTGSYLYYSDNELKAVQIPYKERELAMTVFLPAEDTELSTLIEKLDYERYHTITNSLSYQRVNLQIPKFTFEARYLLKEVFRKLGMTVPFSAKADFTGMTGEKERFLIDEIIHQSFIEVEEKGTEAAAATAVIMRTTSMLDPQEEILFKADRPFLFFIRDTLSGTVLFTGTLHTP
jgi:serpin B